MREGVSRVALRLFEHNEKAYHAAVRMMEQYGKAAIVHPTGTGKSFIAFKLIEDNPEKLPRKPQAEFAEKLVRENA